MCELAGVSRASFYRNWEKREPIAAEMALRDAIQRAVTARPYYGYRRRRTMTDFSYLLFNAYTRLADSNRLR